MRVTRGLGVIQKYIVAFEKFFLFWVPLSMQKNWKTKLESAYSFILKYSKITVWAKYLGAQFLARPAMKE